MELAAMITQFITTELMPYLENKPDMYHLNLLAQGLDSLKLMHLIDFVEKTAGCEFSAADSVPANFVSVYEIMQLIEKQRA